MATGSVTVRLRNKQSGVLSNAITVNYTIGSSTLGWSPPDSTVTDIQSMLAKYPNPKYMRLYTQPGGGIAPWNSGILSLVPNNCVLHYSFKDWNSSTSPPLIYDWFTNRPTARQGVKDIVTLDHEPEQQDPNDPTPAEFKQEWQELIAAVGSHPRRNEFKLGPTFTEWYANHNQGTWWNDFGIVSSYAGVDVIGFDVYDTGYSTYRTPTERNAYPLQIARQVGKPLIYAEWGIAKKTYDTDGSLAAQAMRDNMSYLRQQPDVPYVSWFYRGGVNLDTRPLEKQAFIDLMAMNP